MEPDEPGWQPIDDFFAAQAAGRTDATVRRYARIRRRLMEFLDVGEMADWLGTDAAAVLSAERQFHDRGAFWQLFGPDELVCCLPAFLCEPWLPEGVGEARTQISLVSRLLKALARAGLLDMAAVECAYLDAEAAVRQARASVEVRTASREPDDWAERIPQRFLGGTPNNPWYS